ncbi:MAG: transglycosylase SLT domain-containing protein [Prevotella sp.]|nr:transglycosylase SLT domain-containing protein [Prevotella sp.]
MRKRIFQLIVVLLMCIPMAQAQVNDDFEILFTDEVGEEEVIEVPEALTMRLAIDSMLTLYHNQNNLSIDEACESTGENPNYTEDEYVRRLSRMPTVMEMPYNQVVRKFIDRYCVQLRRSVSMMLGSVNFYMPIFEQALDSYNLPTELKYLPVIESALNPKAVSRAGATGLWQFMLATGKQYGLRVNSLVDDRRDPIRSSFAAAQYLRDLYRIFNDWTLVIAAYNCGPENVNKAIRRSGGSMDYWKIYPYLPSETRGYVPAFIAANYVMNYYCDHNICPMLTHLPEHTDTIEVNRNISLNTIARFCDIDIDMLRDLNPQYRRDIVNGATEPSLIRMTIPAINRFIEQQDTIFAYEESHVNKRSYVAVDESKASRTTSRRSNNESASNGRTTSRYGRSSHSSHSSASASSSSRYGKSQKSGGSYKSSSSSRRRGRRG